MSKPEPEPEKANVAEHHHQFVSQKLEPFVPLSQDDDICSLELTDDDDDNTDSEEEVQILDGKVPGCDEDEYDVPLPRRLPPVASLEQYMKFMKHFGGDRVKEFYPYMNKQGDYCHEPTHIRKLPRGRHETKGVKFVGQVYDTKSWYR